MSEYTEALSELAALPGRLDRQLAQSEQKIAAERKQREREIEDYAGEHEAVVAQLEQILQRARSEGVDLSAGSGADRRGGAEAVSADPLEHARQLVTRLDEALTRVLFTRSALQAEEATLSEEEKRRLAEERRRREREELRRAEQWERARQGTVGLVVALVVATVAGMLAGLTGSVVAVVAVPLLAAAACFAQATSIVSTLPALAVRRATGSTPSSPSAPPRETRLGGAGHAGAALGLSGLGAACLALATGVPGLAPTVAGLLAACGAIVTVAIWAALPRRESPRRTD